MAVSNAINYALADQALSLNSCQNRQKSPISGESPPDYILLSLRTGERMSILSESVAMAANDGEAYESLVRQINTLHHNLECLKGNCRQALYQYGFYTPGGPNPERKQPD
ncbi:MAG: hypothetical protein AB2660_18545 [Candidatus Thiodiazotropha sp.]